MKTSKTIIVRTLTTLAATLLVSLTTLGADQPQRVRVALVPGAGTQQQAAGAYDYAPQNYVPQNYVPQNYQVAPSSLPQQYNGYGPTYDTSNSVNNLWYQSSIPSSYPQGNSPNGSVNFGVNSNFGASSIPTGCANGQCSPNGYGTTGVAYPHQTQPYLNPLQNQYQTNRFVPQGYDANNFATQPAGFDGRYRFQGQGVRPQNVAPNATYPAGSEFTNVPANSNNTWVPNWNWNAQPVQPVSYPQQMQYQPAPVQPAVPQVNSVDDIGTKLTMRYQNPAMLDFLSRTNFNQTMALYNEATRLIDNRHVSPPSYEVRTRQAVTNLILALENPAFLRASGVSPNPQLIASTQQELNGLLQSQAPRTAIESTGLMQWAADLANQRLGVRKEAVALEYLNATLDSLDKYSSFVPTKNGSSAQLDVELMQTAGLEENIVGVGIELKIDERGALVMGTIPNGPAAQARLTKGDVLVGIDGKSLAGMPLSQIANMISGPLGSTVSFRVLRNGQEYTASLRRQNVYVSSVADAQMLSQETGYVRVKQFSESTVEDLEKVLWPMYQKGMKSIVLDLRGNPGGLLTEAIQLSDMFVPCGRIVATKGRSAEDNSDERARWEKTWSQPLVVLVDGDSASASEIFAAAIQENGRGVVVGRTSYGKGTVQTHFPLSSVSGNLKLTTAKFYSPTGREMAGTGVTPDITVPAAAIGTVATTMTQDADVQAALRTIADGTANRLAQESSKCQQRYDLSRLGN